jgi:hypothetical protein
VLCIVECHTALQVSHTVQSIRLRDAGGGWGPHGGHRQRQRGGQSAQRQHRQPPQAARPQAACGGHVRGCRPWGDYRLIIPSFFIHDIHCTNTQRPECQGGPYACSLRCMCFWCCCSTSDEAGKHGAGAMAGAAAPRAANTAPTAPQCRHHLRRAAQPLQVCAGVTVQGVPPCSGYEGSAQASY